MEPQLIKLRSIPILLLLLLFTACRHEVELKCADENIIRINPEAKAYFHFKPGTWWLYEQEGTGLTDSIWVSRSNFVWDNHYEKSSCQCGYGKCIELAAMTLENRVYNGEEHLYGHNLSTSFYDGQTTVYGSSPGYRVSFSPLFGEWLYLGKDQLVNTGSSWSEVEPVASLTVNGQVYKDLLHWYVPGKDYGNSWQRDVWVARNFYVVRFIRYDSTVWNLVRYHIVQ